MKIYMPNLHIYLMTSLSQFLSKPGDKHIMTPSKHGKHNKVRRRATSKNCKVHQRSKRRHNARWIEISSKRQQIFVQLLAI